MTCRGCLLLGLCCRTTSCPSTSATYHLPAVHQRHSSERPLSYLLVRSIRPFAVIQLRRIPSLAPTIRSASPQQAPRADTKGVRRRRRSSVRRPSPSKIAQRSCDTGPEALRGDSAGRWRQVESRRCWLFCASSRPARPSAEAEVLSKILTLPLDQLLAGTPAGG